MKRQDARQKRGDETQDEKKGETRCEMKKNGKMRREIKKMGRQDARQKEMGRQDARPKKMEMRSESKENTQNTFFENHFLYKYYSHNIRFGERLQALIAYMVLVLITDFVW